MRSEEATGRPVFERLGRRLLVPAALALVVLVVLVLVADGRKLIEEIRRFDLWILVPVLGLSLVNYALRFVRWQLYLKRIEVSLDFGASLAIFLFGFVLSVTPGKAGELGKAWLVRALGGGPVRRALAAVVAERVSDLTGMLVLTAVGALALPQGIWICLLLLGAAAFLTVVLTWSFLFHRLVGLLKRLPKIGHRMEALDEAYERLRVLLRPGVQLPAIVLSTLAWAAEGVGFWFVVRAYDPTVSVLLSAFNYGASTLAGGLTMLPGGLLASEGALTALLDYQGLETAAAASATLVIRGATLWFAVGLGLMAIPYLTRRLRKYSEEKG